MKDYVRLYKGDWTNRLKHGFMVDCYIDKRNTVRLTYVLLPETFKYERKRFGIITETLLKQRKTTLNDAFKVRDIQ
jgi:hypothetical protein